MQVRVLREDLENWESDFSSETSAPCSKQSQLWGQLRLLRALCASVLKNSKDGDHPTSLDNVFHCLTVLMGKRFESLLFKFMPVVSCPPAVHCCEEPFSIFLMTSSHRWWWEGAADLSTVPPKQSFIQAEQVLVRHPSLTGQMLQILTSPWLFAELAPVCPCSSCTGGTTTGCGI